MTERLAVAAILLSLASGLAGFVLPRSRAAGWFSAGLLSTGAAVGVTAGLLALLGQGGDLQIAWALPLGSLHIALDPLAGAFYVPLFVVTCAVAVYGQGYATDPHHQRLLRGFLGLMVAGIAVLFAARDTILFLIGWETMAIAAFFLVGTEHEKRSAREASMIYLIATHCGTLMLIGMFALWREWSGSFEWSPLDFAVVGPQSTVLLLLALGGFGLKAGLMPLHFWLPGAHASAPTHISALMSGVLIKCGIYGLLRVALLVTNMPLWFGSLVLILGMVSGIAGVLFALAQHDIKRLLAYHSIENIGIILVGAGIAILGGTLGKPVWVAFGLTGAVLHVWNHALFKSLLFLGAGSVIKATGTREIDRLGGVAHAMPWTAAMFLAGAVAICGFPPLNGFVSEFLVMLGSVSALTDSTLTAHLVLLGTPAVAMMGALAALCFIKVYGTVFLGRPRSAAVAKAEAPWSMRLGMLILMAACAGIGLLPTWVYPLLRPILPPDAAAAIGDIVTPALRMVSVAAIAITAGSALGWVWLRRREKREPAVSTATWGCGYAAPTPRMQYSASSFAETAVVIFRLVLRPTVHRPRMTALFPTPQKYESHVADPVLDRVLKPGATLAVRGISWAHVLQAGQLQLYLVYFLVILTVIFLFWS